MVLVSKLHTLCHRYSKKDLKPGLFFKIITQVYYIRIDLSVSGDYIKNSLF